MLAQVYGKNGQAEAGLAMLAEALALIEKNGERFCEAELYRLKGELLLQSAEGKARRAESEKRESMEIESCFQQALEIARRQQAKSVELHVAMSLGRFWQKQGKLAEARQLLSEVYHWFTEGFDLADLKDARALLEQWG
jgi:predicted ATPase